jgi:hypothetical protein
MHQGIVGNILFLISQLQLFGGIGVMGYFSGTPMQALSATLTDTLQTSTDDNEIKHTSVSDNFDFIDFL